jgi:hypothetical protein
LDFIAVGASTGSTTFLLAGSPVFGNLLGLTVVVPLVVLVRRVECRPQHLKMDVVSRAGQFFGQK